MAVRLRQVAFPGEVVTDTVVSTVKLEVVVAPPVALMLGSDPPSSPLATWLLEARQIRFGSRRGSKQVRNNSRMLRPHPRVLRLLNEKERMVISEWKKKNKDARLLEDTESACFLPKADQDAARAADAEARPAAR